VGTIVRALTALLLASCATAPEPASPPTAAPAPVEQAPAPYLGPRENTAVAGLMESARADAAAGRLPSAAASLERALRIEPRNPRLWNRLARVRLQQGDPAQAEGLAARSNSLAGGDAALRAENQRIIDEARAAPSRKSTY
jgi:hypothetical protein